MMIPRIIGIGLDPFEIMRFTVRLTHNILLVCRTPLGSRLRPRTRLAVLSNAWSACPVIVQSSGPRPPQSALKPQRHSHIQILKDDHLNLGCLIVRARADSLTEVLPA